MGQTRMLKNLGNKRIGGTRYMREPRPQTSNILYPFRVSASFLAGCKRSPSRSKCRSLLFFEASRFRSPPFFALRRISPALVYPRSPLLILRATYDALRLSTRSAINKNNHNDNSNIRNETPTSTRMPIFNSVSAAAWRLPPATSTTEDTAPATNAACCALPTQTRSVGGTQPWRWVDISRSLLLLLQPVRSDMCGGRERRVPQQQFLDWWCLFRFLTRMHMRPRCTSCPPPRALAHVVRKGQLSK